jgi:hypothetical protein
VMDFGVLNVGLQKTKKTEMAKMVTSIYLGTNQKRVSG